MNRSRRWPAAFVLLAGWAAGACSRGGPGDAAGAHEPADLVRLAIHGGARDRDASIARLRGMGPAGLAAILSSSDAEDARRGRLDARPDELTRAAIDRVAAQKDALASGLYWHTDFDAAKQSAAASGRPILSLRLLGNLDEDLTCANSRFFRTTLYPDEKISRVLRERFVLHWRSVRPVPKLTVDYGDGRRLETTITGNSIHYILLPDGSPIDAMPGLWGSQPFLAELERAEKLAQALVALPESDRPGLLTTWHDEQGRALLDEFDRDLATAGSYTKVWAPAGPTTDFRDDIIFSTGSFVTFPDGSKTAVELPIMGALVPGTQPMRGEIDDATWSALARLHEDECRLDEHSRELARTKELRMSVAGENGPRGTTRNLDPLFRKLERSIAEDTVRNRYIFQVQLHRWFADGKVPADVENLNERVYQDMFHSPTNDEWLGLVPPDTYRALDGAGIGM